MISKTVLWKLTTHEVYRLVTFYRQKVRSSRGCLIIVARWEQPHVVACFKSFNSRVYLSVNNDNNLLLIVKKKQLENNYFFAQYIWIIGAFFWLSLVLHICVVWWRGLRLITVTSVSTFIRYGGPVGWTRFLSAPNIAIYQTVTILLKNIL